MTNKEANQDYIVKRNGRNYNVSGIVNWLRNPKNKEELIKRASKGGKAGYYALKKWEMENPELVLEQKRNNMKKCQEKFKERNDYMSMKIASGKKGSHDDKVKAGKINAEKHYDLLVKNANEYGHRGGKKYTFDGLKFRSKAEIKIYNMLKQKNIKFKSMFNIGKKEIDFFLPKQKIFIEYHPNNPLYSNKSFEEYSAERRNIIANSSYSNNKLVVLQTIPQVKHFIGGLI